MPRKRLPERLPCKGCRERAECQERMTADMAEDEWDARHGVLECSRLRDWLGRRCRAKSSVRAALIGDIAQVERLIVARFERGQWVDNDGEPLPEEAIALLAESVEPRVCRDCPEFDVGDGGKSGYCRWLDGLCNGDSCADGCAGWPVGGEVDI